MLFTLLYVSAVALGFGMDALMRKQGFPLDEYGHLKYAWPGVLVVIAYLLAGIWLLSQI